MCLVYRKYYRSLAGSTLLFLGVAFVLMLIPVLNLENVFVREIQSDRYSYVASAFFYPLLLLLANRLLSSRLLVGFGTVHVLICGLCLWSAVLLWKTAGELSMSLIKNYPLEPEQKAYVLNFPDNYKGAYALRNGFNEGLSVYYKKEYKTSTEKIALVNVYGKGNENYVEIVNDSVYYVKNLVDGKWFNYFGRGNFKTEIDEWRTSYTLTVRPLPSENIYILQCYGDTWKVVDTVQFSN
jgi:hypothetical protein